jgi:zinc transport system permease protein
MEAIAMGDFFNALTDPDMAFLRYALILSVIASIPLGAVGTMVVVRRISYLAAAIAHSVLGGIGVALYATEVLGWVWLTPALGSLLAAVLSAAIVGVVSIYARQREDAVIGAIWVTGMALGLICMHASPRYIDPMAYLFGDILLVGVFDIQLAAIVAIVIIGALVFGYRQIVAVCFDSEFAVIRGVRAQWVYLLLLQLAALSVVILVSLVGIVLVIALLTLPPAVASLRARSLWQMLLGSICLNLIFLLGGLFLSFYMDLPTGPVVIVLAAGVYLLSIALGLVFTKK